MPVVEPVAVPVPVVAAVGFAAAGTWIWWAPAVLPDKSGSLRGPVRDRSCPGRDE